MFHQASFPSWAQGAEEACESNLQAVRLAERLGHAMPRWAPHLYGKVVEDVLTRHAGGVDLAQRKRGSVHSEQVMGLGRREFRVTPRHDAAHRWHRCHGLLGVTNVYVSGSQLLKGSQVMRFGIEHGSLNEIPFHGLFARHLKLPGGE